MSKSSIPAKGGVTPAEGKKLLRIVDDFRHRGPPHRRGLRGRQRADPLLALLRVIRTELMAARDDLHAAGQKGGADA